MILLDPNRRTSGDTVEDELELKDRGTVLERWLAHHLAEVITEAEHAVEPAKVASEAQAVDLILRLWAHRRTLPEPVDPLGGYREAVGVPDRLVPGADTADAETTRSDRSHSFWSSLSLTELAEAQGVAPVEDLEGIAALWPSDDNPDEVLAHVLAERAARRRVARSDTDR